MAGRWPDASRNLLHFLGNSGEQLEQDVDRMLADLPELSDAVALQEATVGSLAVVTGARRAALAPLLLLALPACGGDLEA